MSGQARPGRFYAVYVTSSMEEKVALMIINRVSYMGLDVRSIVVPVDIKGYIILEVGSPADLYEAIRGLRHVKRKRPLLMKPEDVVKLASPAIEIPQLEPGMVVEIIGGPFKGMRGKVVSVSESKGEVDLVLLETDIDMVVTVPLEQVKPAQEE